MQSNSNSDVYVQNCRESVCGGGGGYCHDDVRARGGALPWQTQTQRDILIFIIAIKNNIHIIYKNNK